MSFRSFPLPNFAEETAATLVDAYNELNEGTEGFKPRKAAFPSKEEAVARCQAAWKAWAKANPETPEAKEARIAATKAAKEAEREERRAAKEASKVEVAKIKAERKPKADGKGLGRRSPDSVIKVLAAANPRREGTVSYKMFEVMQKYPKVADYLDHAAKYSKVAEDNRRKDASQWLSNAVRDGHVEIVD